MSDTCPECGKELSVSDWPWCPHGSTNPYVALYGDPTIIHIDESGNYRFPAAPDAPIPPGYQKVELRTRRER